MTDRTRGGGGGPGSAVSALVQEGSQHQSARAVGTEEKGRGAWPAASRGSLWARSPAPALTRHPRCVCSSLGLGNGLCLGVRGAAVHGAGGARANDRRAANSGLGSLARQVEGLRGPESRLCPTYYLGGGRTSPRPLKRVWGCFPKSAFPGGKCISSSKQPLPWRPQWKFRLRFISVLMGAGVLLSNPRGQWPGESHPTPVGGHKPGPVLSSARHLVSPQEKLRSAPCMRLTPASCLPRASVTRRTFGHSGIAVHTWYACPALIKSIWAMAISQHQFYLDRKQSKVSACPGLGGTPP